EGGPPRFLQLYIYDTKNEVDNRMSHFGGDNSELRRDIVEGLIELLDNHNALVQLFRTAREKLLDSQFPPFKVRLFNTDMNFDIIIEQWIWQPQRVSKLHPSYMALKFPLLEQTLNNESLLVVSAHDLHGDSDGSDCGRRLILPQSFTGGPRYMYAHYLDALAICRVHGNPSYFVTFTCNVKWPEITEYMDDFLGVTTADRADIVDRVFEMNIHQFVKYLRDMKPFGKIIALVYTVEFQTHGLSHCHTLIWVDEDSRIQNPEDIDNYISAELPSKEIDPEGHRVVAEFMIHSPCGEVCPTAACMKNGPNCTKHFPKEYCLNTYIDAAGFVHYPRRDTRITTTKQNVELDNGSFRDIRTINQTVYPTCRAACEAMGLLGDDIDWETTLTKASSTATPSELRTLLAHILTHCQVLNPLALWNRTWNLMSNDIPYFASISLVIPNLYIHLSELESYTKYEFEACLDHCSRSLTDFGIPLPPPDLMSVLRNRLLMEEKSYNRELLAIERDKLIDKLNDCQRNIFNLIVHAVATKTQQLTFIYGHGGTEKIFLWKTIIYALSAEGKIVLAVASSGIASLTKNTQLATLLKETDLIIWDESPMNDRRCFETLDRTLRDILDTPNRLFGGKPIVLGGDFRQTLPVKKSASHSEIISSSIAESYLWRSFKLFILTENMCLTQRNLSDVEKEEVSTFSSWLLNVGGGVLGVPDESDPENASWIEIPAKFQIPNDENRLTKLIQFIYDEHTLLHPTAQDLQDKAIVCPKNNTAYVINANVMNMLPGMLLPT
ncbi:DNA helicase, partial [Tanacetum coccineum]